MSSTLLKESMVTGLGTYCYSRSITAWCEKLHFRFAVSCPVFGDKCEHATYLTERKWSLVSSEQSLDLFTFIMESHYQCTKATFGLNTFWVGCVSPLPSFSQAA